MRYLRNSLFFTRLTGLILFCVLPVAPLQAQAPADSYRVIRPAQPTRAAEGKVEVVEVFFYGCIHCYNLESFVQQWLESKPENVEFYRMPIVFRDDYRPLAQAFYTAEKLGVFDRIHEPLFSAIHKDQRKLFTDGPLRQFFIEQGVDAAEFDRVYNSAEIKTKVMQAEVMARRYMISSIPTIIVNGKYLTSPAQTGGQRELFTVIEQLVEMEMR